MQHGREDSFEGLYELDARFEEQGIDLYVPAIEERSVVSSFHKC